MRSPALKHTEKMTLQDLTAAYSLTAIVPEIILAVTALVVLLAGAFITDENGKKLLPFLTLAGTIGAGFACVALWNKDQIFGPPDTAIFIADDFSLFFKGIFLFGLAVSVLLSGRFLSARSGDAHAVAGEYYGLMILATVGMMIVASARDLLVVFLGIETLSIALYILAGFARARLLSNEAALKYFLLGAFATGFLLYGIALILCATGTTQLKPMSSAALGPLPNLLFPGIALLVIGLGFKAALVPFHQWTPDVYEGSPTPVTAFMSTGAKAAAFAALFRVLPGAFGEGYIAGQWGSVLMALAVLTMTVGNVAALGQTGLKRMLAYSSIAHAGYLLVPVVAAGAASARGDANGMKMAVAAALFYLLIYALMNLGAFASLVYLENARDDQTNHQNPEFDTEDANLTLDDVKGLGWKSPLPALAFTLFLLSLAGIPPTAGFLGKLAILSAAGQQGLWGLVIVAALNTVVSFGFYARPLVSMWMQDETVGVSGDGAAVVTGTRTASLAVAVAVLVCAAATIILIGAQGTLMPLAQSAANLVGP